MNSIKVSPSSLTRPRINFGRLKTPSPLPIRPLPIDRFRPPRGQKEVFLPNFVITFLHTPTRPANHASFLVPLWFSKLDLKDYLYNAYNIQCLRIRSYVIQSRVREGKPSDHVPARNQWFRPQSTKKMTVELVVTVDSPSDATESGGAPKGQGPFVWPEEPQDWRPWAKEQYANADEQQEKSRDRRIDEYRGIAWPRDLEDVGERAGELMRKAGVRRDSVRADWREEFKKRRDREGEEGDERARKAMGMEAGGKSG